MTNPSSSTSATGRNAHNLALFRIQLPQGRSASVCRNDLQTEDVNKHVIDDQFPFRLYPIDGRRVGPAGFCPGTHLECSQHIHQNGPSESPLVRVTHFISVRIPYLPRWANSFLAGTIFDTWTFSTNLLTITQFITMHLSSVSFPPEEKIYEKCTIFRR